MRKMKRIETMGKKETLIIQLSPLITNRKNLEKFILANSNLPGPRANLELCFALAEIYDDYDVLYSWSQITGEQAGVNDPESFLVFCSMVCLGRMYPETKDIRIVEILKKAATDRRWRIREAVAFGFQKIGEHDFEELKMIFSEWIKKSDNLEKRAILVSLAHPPLLNEDTAAFSLKIADSVLRSLDRTADFDVLKKGLEFTISVFVAADPAPGFSFIKCWMGKDATIDKIMKENLKKNRLAGKYPEEVHVLLSLK